MRARRSSCSTRPACWYRCCRRSIACTAWSSRRSIIPRATCWIHTMLLLEKLWPRCPRTLAWGALLHDVGKPPTFRVAPDRIRFDGHVEVGVRMAEEICRRLHFSGDDTEQIVALVANHMRFGDAGRMKESTLKRFMRLPQIRRAPRVASHGLPQQSWRPDAVRLRARAAHGSDAKKRFARSCCSRADDLIAMGYVPGPRIPRDSCVG